MAAWTGLSDMAPSTFDGLSRLELLVLLTKLRSGSSRARRAALHSRSVPEGWAMFRLSGHLADLGDDVNLVLAGR
jgi:hypothetical protein